MKLDDEFIVGSGLFTLRILFYKNSFYYFRIFRIFRG